jgi:hypothetical protein
MNKVTSKNNSPIEIDHEVEEQDDLRSEYDFSGGVRGKHYRAYRRGHQVKIYKDDGRISVQNFKLEEGAVFLEPDIQPYFPNSDAVNEALRGLIALIPKREKQAA